MGSRRAARAAGIHAANRHAATIARRLTAYAIGSVREAGAGDRESPSGLDLGDGPPQSQLLERPGRQMRRPNHGVVNRHYPAFVSIVNIMNRRKEISKPCSREVKRKARTCLLDAWTAQVVRAAYSGNATANRPSSAARRVGSAGREPGGEARELAGSAREKKMPPQRTGRCTSATDAA